jgi:hypothetical protein
MATSFPFTIFATAAQIEAGEVNFLGYLLAGPNLTPQPVQISGAVLAANVPPPTLAFTATALPPGSAPTVGPNTGTSQAAEYALGLPTGATGATGATGSTGQTGAVATPAVTVVMLSPGSSPSWVVTGGSANAPTVTFSVPEGSILDLPPAPSGVVNNSTVFVGIGSDGNPATFTPSQVTATQTTAFGTMVTQEFTGTGSQLAFTLTAVPSAISYSMVYLAGLLQVPGTYAISGASLSFNTAPASGATIQVLTINASTMAQNLKTIPAGSQLFAVTDASGYTIFEIGTAGQVRPASIQFGLNQTSIPIYNKGGTPIGSLSSTGSLALSGGMAATGEVSGATGSFGGSTFQPSTSVNFGIRDTVGYYLMYVLNGVYHGQG